MAFFIRVDDRLIHGQTMCAWVPYIEATNLVVASDTVAADKVKSSIMTSCCCDEIDVCVKGVDELLADTERSCLQGDRVLLIVSTVSDAVRLYKGGVTFDSLNVGNVHHNGEGHKVAQNVSFNSEEDEMLSELVSLGVKVDIREVPDSEPVDYKP